MDEREYYYDCWDSGRAISVLRMEKCEKLSVMQEWRLSILREDCNFTDVFVAETETPNDFP